MGTEALGENTCVLDTAGLDALAGCKEECCACVYGSSTGCEDGQSKSNKNSGKKKKKNNNSKKKKNDDNTNNNDKKKKDTKNNENETTPGENENETAMEEAKATFKKAQEYVQLANDHQADLQFQKIAADLKLEHRLAMLKKQQQKELDSL